MTTADTAGPYGHEPITPGLELPSIVQAFENEQLRRYAEASRDFGRIHLDEAWARRSPWGRTIVHGTLKAALMGRLVEALGLVHRFKAYYLAPDFPGERLIANGEVIASDKAGGTVECALEIKDPSGRTTSRGRATVSIHEAASVTAASAARPESFSAIPEGDHDGEEDYPDVEKIRRMVGVPWKPRLSQVTEEWLRRFRQAIGEAPKVDASGTEVKRAPPTFLVALDPFYRLSQKAVVRPVDPKVAGNGWDEFIWLASTEAGDEIKACARWLEPYEKQGRSGGLIFLPREVTYLNQRGEMVAVSRGALVRRL